MEIVIATSNLGKWEEIKEVAKDFGILVHLASHLHKQGIIKSPPPKVAETAGSYIGNAKLQADALHAWSGQRVSVQDHGQTLFSGTALGIAPDGALRVGTPEGERRVLSADVSLRLSEKV